MKDVNEMTLDELRIAVATEIMGYRGPASACPYCGSSIFCKRTDKGWYCVTYRNADGSPQPLQDYPDYPNDIAAAFAVIEKLQADGALFSMTYQSGIFDEFDEFGWLVEQRRSKGLAHAFLAHQSLPVAICRCALAAIRAGKGGAQ